MSAPFTTRRFTVEEYHRMAEAGVLHEDDRVELLDGQIVVMSPIGTRHAAAVGRLTRLFSERTGDRAIVWVQNPIVIGRYWEPQPDLCLLRPRADFYAAAHPRPEDVLLAVEVADATAEEDRQRKLPEYARAGIPEAWLVDLAHDTIEDHRDPGAEGYGAVKVLRRGDTLVLLVVPTAPIAADEVLGPKA
ncbi:MAG TPA: Uma2 family endonuclease, partial [Gemmatimonadales bacterium]|nr:Uma2 family endonuclease [Gemmatimonadales bacterium]